MKGNDCSEQGCSVFVALNLNCAHHSASHCFVLLLDFTYNCWGFFNFVFAFFLNFLITSVL